MGARSAKRSDGRIPVGQARLLVNPSADAESDRRVVGRSGPLTEPLLDASEAAALLNVPRTAVYELVRSRGLPHVRVGKRGMRFVRSDLATWVAANTFRGR
jgi:excisionase family DNA binding protein